MGDRGPKPKVPIEVGATNGDRTAVEKLAEGKWRTRCRCGRTFDVDARDFRRRTYNCVHRDAPVLKRVQIEGMCRCCDSVDLKYRGLCGSSQSRV